MTGSVPAAALEVLPLFPLPRVALFPRAILPLHVFEPRYRAMLADALASHRCIAMAMVVDGEEDPPAIARIAGVGEVVEHEALPDGRSHILLRGLARVALDELPFVSPYRRARARVLVEQPTPVTDVERAALQAAAAGFVAEVRRRDLDVDLELPEGLDVGGIADLCAAHIVLDPDVRQEALEQLDVASRVRLVTGELVSQTARLTSARGIANLPRELASGLSVPGSRREAGTNLPRELASGLSVPGSRREAGTNLPREPASGLSEPGSARRLA